MRRLNTDWPNRGVNIWNDSEWWAGKPWEDHPMIWGGNLWPPWHPSFLGFGANQPLYGQTDKFFKIGLGEYSGCYDAYRTSGNGHRIGLFAGFVRDGCYRDPLTTVSVSAGSWGGELYRDTIMALYVEVPYEYACDEAVGDVYGDARYGPFSHNPQHFPNDRYGVEHVACGLVRVWNKEAAQHVWHPYSGLELFCPRSTKYQYCYPSPPPRRRRRPPPRRLRRRRRRRPDPLQCCRPATRRGRRFTTSTRTTRS